MGTQIVTSFCLLMAVCLVTATASAVTPYTLSDLGTLGGSWTDARGINDAGQIVGAALTPGGGHSIALLWQEGVVYDLNDLLVGNPGWELHGGNAINEAGQIAGCGLNPDGDSHALLLNPLAGPGISYTLTDLGTLGGSWIDARGINDAGQIVGAALTPGGGHSIALLWQEGVVYDLNDFLVGSPGWELHGGNAINEAGQIAGCGLNPDGDSHALLLNPIPEPCTLALTALGTVGLLVRRRRLWMECPFTQ